MKTPTVFQFVLTTLAVFRLSMLLSKETGPGRIFQKARRAVPKDSSFKEGIACIFCTSVWHAIPASLFLFFHSFLPWWLADLGDWFIIMLALSAGGMIVNQQWTKG